MIPKPFNLSMGFEISDLRLGDKLLIKKKKTHLDSDCFSSCLACAIKVFCRALESKLQSKLQGTSEELNIFPPKTKKN